LGNSGNILMKALLSMEPGEPQTLRLADQPIPAAKEGQLLIRVLACGINFPDVLIIEDRYQLRPQRPFAPGSEIAGIVEAVGPGVEGWTAGNRLIAAIGYGGLSEYVAIDASRAFHLPDWADPAEAAALLMSYATTVHALADRADLQSGETLLVLGAAGGTGIAAIEIGKALGARVVAAASTAEKAAAAQAAGADVALVYGPPPSDKEHSRALADAFKQAVGSEGAHVIYDPVGGPYCDPAIRCIAWEGRYLVIGFTAGISQLPLNLTLLKSCDVRGVFWGGFAARNRDRNRTNVDRLFAWWKSGVLRPHVTHRWPLAEGHKAIDWLRRREAVGKSVVILAHS
jgi:NADPH:quinone reductase-like Zn-dependent oxidoreductase